MLARLSLTFRVDNPTHLRDNLLSLPLNNLHHSTQSTPITSITILNMQFVKILTAISAILGLVVAAPTPGVEVELYNGTSILEERSHCYDHPNEKPDCRQGK